MVGKTFIGNADFFPAVFSVFNGQTDPGAKQVKYGQGGKSVRDGNVKVAHAWIVYHPPENMREDDSRKGEHEKDFEFSHLGRIKRQLVIISLVFISPDLFALLVDTQDGLIVTVVFFHSLYNMSLDCI